MENKKEINSEKFYLTDLKEQETLININYYERVVFVYTCRKSVADRLRRKLGQPTKIYCTNSKISGVRYDIGFENKKAITSILSRPLLIGNMR